MQPVLPMAPPALDGKGGDVDSSRSPDQFSPEQSGEGRKAANGRAIAFALLLVGFVAFGYFLTTRRDEKTPPGVANHVASPASLPVQPQATPVPRSSWQYSAAKDEMSGKVATYAVARSLNRRDLHWPYGPDVGARIQLQKHPRYGTSAYVILDKGQLLCSSYTSCTITVRFDDAPLEKFEGRGTSDGKSVVAFIYPYDKFMRKLKSASTVLMELPLYQDGNVSWQFNVGELVWSEQ